MEAMNLSYLSKCCGIYVILNVIDWKVYVGQAKVFNKRDHFDALCRGLDSNTKLQEDFNAGKEFVYMIGKCIGMYEESGISKKTLNAYERMYMTLMEEFGFELYNEQCNNSKMAQENRELQKLKKFIDNIDTLYPDEKRTFLENFKSRFGCEPSVFSQSSDETVENRKKALECYAQKRLTRKGREEYASDRFYFSRERIQSMLEGKSRSISSLDIEEVFISKAGNYLGEGLDQILNYEMSSIDTHGYCLWTFSGNAVAQEVVQALRRARREKDKDVYVLFEFTPSSEYADAEKKEYKCLRKDVAKGLIDEELDFLSFDKVDNSGHLYAPEDIDCTASGNMNYAKAFVIQEFFLLDEVFSSGKDEMGKYYRAVRRNGLQDIDDGGYQRSTHYIILTDKYHDLADICKKYPRRRLCFAGKLAAPYVLHLNCIE